MTMRVREKWIWRWELVLLLLRRNRETWDDESFFFLNSMFSFFYFFQPIHRNHRRWYFDSGQCCFFLKFRFEFNSQRGYNRYSSIIILNNWDFFSWKIEIVLSWVTFNWLATWLYQVFFQFQSLICPVVVNIPPSRATSIIATILTFRWNTRSSVPKSGNIFVRHDLFFARDSKPSFPTHNGEQDRQHDCLW